MRVTGITALNLQASGGDSAWLGWPMIAVTWSNARDQVDANTEFLTEAGLRVGDHLTINVGRRLVTTTIVGQVYDPNGPSLSTSRQMLGAVPGLGVTSYRIGLAPGISPQRYSGKLSRRLGPSIGVLFACQGTSRSSAATLALLRAKTEMIVLLAGLGVLSSVLIATRERVRGLGVFKSLGMTPRQTPVMVVCGIMPPAIAASHRRRHRHPGRDVPARRHRPGNRHAHRRLAACRCLLPRGACTRTGDCRATTAVWDDSPQVN